MDNHGNAPYPRVKHMLAPGGRFLMVIGDLWGMISAKWQKPVIAGDDNDQAVSQEAYAELVGLVASGGLRTVIQKVLPFEQIVEAHRIVDGGHKRGSVVVRVGS